MHCLLHARGERAAKLFEDAQRLTAIAGGQACRKRHCLARSATHDQQRSTVDDAARRIRGFDDGHRVIADGIPGFAGPLAGFERGLAHARGALMVTAPCDSPFLPRDLVARLRAALESGNAELAVAKTGDQAHPVFCLLRRELHASLSAFLASGQRKIDRWYAGHRYVEVPFDDAERAYAFYREVFGWNLMPMPEMDYTGVSTGPTNEQGMPTEPGYIGGGMTPRGDMVPAPVITLQVDDIDKTLATLEDHGGSRAGDKITVGEMGFAAYFRDSEGNLMGLWQNAG